MRFAKMHGIGNDYVYVNGFEENVLAPEKLAVTISDRHFGIGSDGLILILPSTVADVRMRMFNADGSESEMCGNGVRCVAKYAWDHGLSKSNPIRVQTGRGVLPIQLHLNAKNLVDSATVNMGAPILGLPEIGVLADKVIAQAAPFYRIPNLNLDAVFVSMGNPHATLFTPDVKAIDLEKIGPQIENHIAFPRRINAHFVQIHSRDEITMRTWERGSGITLACGTGACAAAVSCVLTGQTNRKILAHLPGGDLTLEWKQSDNNVYMTGPATEVFTGEYPH